MSFLFYHILSLLSAIGLYHSMMLTYVFTNYDLKKTSIIHVSLQSALNPCRPDVGPLSDTAANCHSPSDMITSTSTWRGGPGGRDMTLGLKTKMALGIIWR